MKDKQEQSSVSTWSISNLVYNTLCEILSSSRTMKIKQNHRLKQITNFNYINPFNK